MPVLTGKPNAVMLTVPKHARENFMRLLVAFLALAAVLAVPAIASAGCSPQHTVEAPQTQAPPAGQTQPPQTPIPGKTS